MQHSMFKRSRYKELRTHNSTSACSGCQESFPKGLLFICHKESIGVGQAEKKSGDVTSILMIKQANPRKSSWVQMLA